MNLEIRFGRTRSPRFSEAVRQAQKIPGCTKREGEGGVQITVCTSVPFDDPALWRRVQELLWIVGSWQSTSVCLDGKVVDPVLLVGDLSRLIECYVQKKRSDPCLDYCSGKQSPSSDISAFGCRFIQGVSVGPGRENRIPWYEFGRLSADQKRFAVDRDAILGRLRSETAGQACLACPAFSWTHVAEAVDCLPTELDLEKSDRFRVKFSQLDPSKPSGIEPVFPSRHLSIRVSTDFEKDTPTLAMSPKRNIPKVFYSDIGAQDDAVQQLRDICELPFTHSEYFAHLRLRPHRGIILSGPPGNGKTLMAKAVATQSAAHLELISGPEIRSKWVGQSEKNLRGVFERAQALAPSIIVIDELDAIAPHRGTVDHNHHDVTLVSQLLVLLDGMEEFGRVVVIGTTNRLAAIDAAIKRPGRFDYHIQVPLPDAKAGYPSHSFVAPDEWRYARRLGSGGGNRRMVGG